MKYNVSNFLDKNKDLVWKDLLLICESSSSRVMSHSAMFPRGGAASAGLARPVTAGTNFKSQVQTLMDTLSKCAPHYIRCIKPNDVKKAGVFNDEMNLHQIRYLGLLENVRVRRAGFAFRQTFDRFLTRYKMLSQATWPNSNHLAPEAGCKAIMSALSIAEGPQYQMGKTKIFIRQPISLFTLEELRERKLHILATLIQKIYRSYRTRKYFREMREKSLGLFGRNKLRRRASVRRFYVGDYLNLAGNPIIAKMLAKYKDASASGASSTGGSNILFADYCDKINRKSKTQRRILLLTTNAVYNLGEGKYKENRRIAIRDISKVSVSPYADNYTVLHVAKEYDYLVVLERKTEFLTALSDAYQRVTGSTLPLNFATEVSVATKEKKAQQLSFVKNDAVSGVSHLPDSNNKDRLVVTVGKLDTVSDAYLKALEPVVMKRTDPALKPKPGYVARQQPTQVRGIVQSGQKASTPAASSSSSSSASSSSSSSSSNEVWARAVEDFTGADSRELSFKKGAQLRVLSQDESGWWSCSMNGPNGQAMLGYAPSTYLEKIAKPLDRRPSMHQAPLPPKRW